MPLVTLGTDTQLGAVVPLVVPVRLTLQYHTTNAIGMSLGAMYDQANAYCPIMAGRRRQSRWA